MSEKKMDDCVDEIFKTVHNEDNSPDWRVMKTRFYRGKLSEKSKIRLLAKFGYEKVKDAVYKKKK